ncbi:hypothetical protein QM996_01985 [Sinorhizobium chiapasense]
MAKRNGRGGDVVEMELDLEVGWACQLLAKFGPRSELSLEGDCPGLTYLLKNGVPASHVDAIRTNYRGELSTARSPGFEDGGRAKKSVVEEKPQTFSPENGWFAPPWSPARLQRSGGCPLALGASRSHCDNTGAD